MKDSFVIGRFDRNLADVKRWAIVRTIRSQSVAEHSYYVALMMKPLLEHHGYDDPVMIMNAVQYALIHDRDEVLSGDIATPAKRRMTPGAFNALNEEFGLNVPEPDPVIKKAAKVLDLLEAAMFLAEECGMGNHRVSDVLLVIRRKLAKACKEFEEDAPKKQVGGLYAELSCVITYCAHSKVDPLEPMDP